MSYGPIWVDLEGYTVLPAEIDILRHPNTGGVLLFAKNYQSRQQLIELVQAIRDYAQKPVLIGVDREGGRIWRFGADFCRPLAAREYGQLYQLEPARALVELQRAGSIVARELLDCGIDLTFAPVLDLDHGLSEVIGDRSYGADPLTVSACAAAFIAGLHEQGMGCIGKHFPGHGGCVMDSHFTIATDTRSLEKITQYDLVPFAQLHMLLTGVMPAHVIYEKIDVHPAGFSTIWLQQILRQQIGFRGAIISDCLSMSGAGVLDYAAGAECALTAGCDMVILTQQTREVLWQTLNAVHWDVQKQQHHRIANLAATTRAPNKTNCNVEQFFAS